MNLARGALSFAASTFAFFAFTGIVSAAEPNIPRRVIVAGPDNDLIAARVQRELQALGFETIRADALEGCARSAVVTAALDKGAVAAACSDGDQVGVWVSDGSTLRLKDVVVSREEGDRGREVTAVRAAEVTRATIALKEQEDEAARNAPPPKPQPAGGWETFEKDKAVAKPKAKPSIRRTPTFSASAGISALLGIDASVGAFSGQLQYGVLRWLSVAARLEYPIESQRLSRSFSTVRVAPAFAGVGAELPILPPTSFVIPRFGAGAGFAWINATKPGQQVIDNIGVLTATTTPGDDSVASFALYATAGLSMRIVGPLRIGADALFGSTTARLVVRDNGTRVAYWGAPLASLALRVELMFK